MAEAACIEVAQPDALQEHERLARAVARRVHGLIVPLTEWKFPEFVGQQDLDEADALLMDADKTDGTWMGDGARPPMEEFLARVAERLTEANLAVGAAETEGRSPITAARCLLREALPLAIALSNAFCICRLTGDASALIALQEGRQPALTHAPEHKPAPAESKEHHVLTAIALKASILLDLLDSAGRSTDLYEVHELSEAARVVGACIGSLADGMTGEIARGDQYDWHQARETRSPT